ncbi:hypothetical protein VR010_03910 [Actinomycetaceae bacterium L2_0104]
MPSSVGIARLLRSLEFQRGWSDGVRLEVDSTRIGSDPLTINFSISRRISVNERQYSFLVTLESEEGSPIILNIRYGVIFEANKSIKPSDEALTAFGNYVAAPLIHQNLQALISPIAEAMFGTASGLVPPLEIIQNFDDKNAVEHLV